MWPRYVEVMLGLWLAVSPFVFAHGSRQALWVWDFTTSAILIVVPILAHLERLRRVHLLLLLPAGALVLRGWLQTQSGPHDAASQNHIVVGLLVLMIAIIPSPASLPPGHRWMPVRVPRPGPPAERAPGGS